MITWDVEMPCPECGVPISTLAAALWKDAEHPRLTIWCRNHEHRIAKIFSIEGQLILCMPSSRHLASALNMESTTENRHVHAHADIIEVNDVEWDRERQLRCACGSHEIQRGEILNVIGWTSNTEYSARIAHLRSAES